MKELIQSNVYNDADSAEIIKATLSHLTARLSQTLGPFGSTTVIADRTIGHTVSKDGYTVLGTVKYNGVIPNTILDIVKKISKVLVKEVGDGSTSAIVVSNYLYNGIYDLKNKYNVAPKEILSLLNYLEKILEERIKDLATPITEDNFNKLQAIASVSNNNDDKAGELIYKLYEIVGAEGFINIELSKNEADSFEVTQGIEFDGGYLDRSFANCKNRVDCVYDYPKVLICNETIDAEDMNAIGELLGQAMKEGKPFVLIAKNYDFEMQNFFKINRQQLQDKFQCVPLMYPLPTLEYQDRLEDLAIYLGATIYNKHTNMRPEDLKYEHLGECTKITARDDVTNIINNEPGKEVENRILELNTFIEENDLDAVDLYAYKKRIAILSAKMAVLYVGGNSVLEKETRKYLMEDAIYACKSTIKNGYIRGGNLVIPTLIAYSYFDLENKLLESKLCKSISDEEMSEEFIRDLLDTVLDAFKQSFVTVLNNKFNDEEKSLEYVNKCIDEGSIFNLIEHRFESDEETNIINSPMTDIEIMKASFSMVGLLATSNQFITYEPCIPIISAKDLG